MKTDTALIWDQVIKLDTYSNTLNWQRGLSFLGFAISWAKVSCCLSGSMKSMSKGWSIMLRYANPGWIHYGLIIEFCKGYLHARPAQRLLNPPTPPSLHFLHHTFFCTFVCTPGILASNMNHFHSPSSCLNCRQRAKKARIQYSANAELNFEGLSCRQSSLPPPTTI